MQLMDLIGKTVWFRTSKCDVNTGRVEKIYDMRHVWVRTETGRKCIYENDIFLTKEDLLSANYAVFKHMVDEFKRNMEDIAATVTFCYDHMKQDEHAARAAVRQKVRELLDIEVDPEAAELEKELETDWESVMEKILEKRSGLS